MINKNRLSVLAIAALITVSLAACSSGKKESAAGSQTSAAQVDEIQTSGTQTTDTSAGDTAGKDAVKLITSTSQLPGASTQLLQSRISEVSGQKGGGNFRFEHYDSATLFKSSAELGALLDGNIDIGFIQLGYFYDNGALWANMFDIAFLYDDVDDMMQVLDTEGEVGKWVQDQIWDEFHVKVIAPFYLGRRDVWLSDGSLTVQTPEDLKGVKIRMPNSASFLDMGTAIGAEPTPLDSSETYLAMQTGTVDAQENIILSSYANAMQEVSKSIVMTDHMITANLVCVNGDKWENMTPEQQELLTQVIREAVEQNNQDVMAEEAKILDECVEKYGINLQEPDKDAFKEYAFKYYLSNPDTEKNWNMDIFNEITK